MTETKIAEVRCPYPSCRRYMGAFVGRSQCPGCKRWVTVMLQPSDESAKIAAE